MRPDTDRILIVIQRRMVKFQRTLALLTLLWVAVVGLLLMAQMTPEDMVNHRSSVVQHEVQNCSGTFDQRYDCTETILLAGQWQGLLEVIKRIGLTLLLPAVAWGVWWGVQWRFRQIYWLPPIARFRYFA